MNTSNSQDKQSPTILIVDDTPANIGVLVDYLEYHAYRVVVAQDGEEALSRAQFAQPDLILLDVMMPGMDGFETCARLKTMQDVKDIPVIFMTALTDTSDKVKGFGAGGVDYVTKPFQIEEILARIHTHLSLRLMQRQVAEQNLLLQQEITIREQAEQSLLSSYEDLKLSKQQQEQLHQQLLQSEKMASIGQLAAGVAHEINNPIAFVNSNLSALQQYVEEMWSVIDAGEQLENALTGPNDALNKIRQLRAHLDLPFIREDLQHLLGESLEGIQRVRRIVQDLRDFSHVGEIEKQLSNLHHGLDSTLNIASVEIRNKAQVIKEYGDIPDILCVAAQINQVFMNLLINAAQSIEQTGTITIRTGQDTDHVWIEIADSGCGIPEENLAHIFEPFFTTKPVGTGTGLGLSLSYGIIQQHGGKIEVNSKVGSGTTFRIWLPKTPALSL